jgi:hypothetical protein
MTKESEVERTARFTRRLLIGIIVFILVIVLIVGAYFGILMHSLTSILTPNSTPTPNPTSAKYTIHMSPLYGYNIATMSQMGISINNWVGTEDITFSTTDISYNRRLGNTYGNFAPQLRESGIWPYIEAPTISGYTVRAGYAAYLEIDLPKGAGSPWVSGMTVIVAIQTSTAQGSTTITLP